jgi:hypothetical protein
MCCHPLRPINPSILLGCSSSYKRTCLDLHGGERELGWVDGSERVIGFQRDRSPKVKRTLPVGQTSPSANLPPPPSAIGCYILSSQSNSWASTQCDSSAIDHKLPKPTEGGSSGVKGETSKASINYGEIQYYPSVPRSPGISDSSWGSGSFSVQANTNGFTGTNGHLDAVQFTDQNDEGSPSNNLCIWQVDVTSQNYDNNCMSLPYYMVGLYGYAWLYMLGYVYHGNIYAQFCMERRSYCYDINTSDEYGLGGRYLSLTGTILGYGSGSKANFVKGSTMGTTVGLYQSSKPFASGEQRVETVEQNNLGTQSTGTISCSSSWCYLSTQAT